ncbi:MAG: rRNA maturation RNase YbeY [Sulfitobacter sp.]
MHGLDIVVEDNRWEDYDFDIIAQAAAQATLSMLSIDSNQAELTILACNDLRIATLNADFRGKPTPTNVLSWPSEERAAPRAGDNPQPPEPGLDGMIELGDIAISFDTCKAEAVAADKSMASHVTHLIIHGVLHLLGYDHIRDPDATLMEQLEVGILGKLGYDDPYTEISANKAVDT